MVNRAVIITGASASLRGFSDEAKRTSNDYCAGWLNPQAADSNEFDSGAFDTRGGSRCKSGHPACG
jgi:hypothetical protein